MTKADMMLFTDEAGQLPGPYRSWFAPGRVTAPPSQRIHFILREAPRGGALCGVRTNLAIDRDFPAGQLQCCEPCYGAADRRLEDGYPGRFEARDRSDYPRGTRKEPDAWMPVDVWRIRRILEAAYGFADAKEMIRKMREDGCTVASTMLEFRWHDRTPDIPEEPS